jgi:hypothetical protein
MESECLATVSVYEVRKSHPRDNAVKSENFGRKSPCPLSARFGKPKRD